MLNIIKLKQICAVLFVISFYAMFNHAFSANESGSDLHIIENNAREKIDDTNPYLLIQGLANNTFTSIKLNKEQISNTKVARSIINTELLPYIDNKYASFKVLGNHLKTTTTEQRQTFTDAFTKYIVATYADALKKYTNQTIEVEAQKNVTDSIVAVKVFVKESGKPDLEVIFKMRKNSKTQKWKAYDMVAEGISLLSAKQSELSTLIRQHGIDYVSNLLNSHVNNSEITKINN
jgi:phospholipid transport system substrate-binding protein